MNIVLFGYGKMGKNIYRSLEKSPLVQQIYVVDPAFGDEKVVPHQYKSFNEIDPELKIDAAVVASNSVTHSDVLQQVLDRGIKNIFCEKPMCLTKKEYDLILKRLPKNAHFVVDYILRSSGALKAFQDKYEQLEKQGYVLTSCNIDYGKDKRKDPRRFKDIGVYEELYHVWDLAFNGPLFGPLKDIKVLHNVYTPDPEIEDRCIQQRFKYDITKADGQHFDLKLNSSFQKESLQRSFICFLSKGSKRKVLSLTFDCQGKDKCTLVHDDTHVDVEDFIANTKLDTIINDSLTYFKTGVKKDYLHTADDSARFHDLIVKLKQVKPLSHELIKNRIAQTHLYMGKN